MTKSTTSQPRSSCAKLVTKEFIHQYFVRCQNDEVFSSRQPQHNWTKEWCEFLNYVRTIDIAHNASPEQQERYAALFHFRYDPK